MTGPVGVIDSPQLLVTAGGVGTVIFDGQDTVAEPFAGTVKSLRSIVYTKFQVAVFPSQSV